MDSQITKNTKKCLGELGFCKEDIRELIPEDARIIVENNFKTFDELNEFKKNAEKNSIKNEKDQNEELITKEKSISQNSHDILESKHDAICCISEDKDQLDDGNLEITATNKRKSCSNALEIIPSDNK